MLMDDPMSTDKSTTTKIRRWTVLSGQCHQNGHAQMLMDDPMSTDKAVAPYLRRQNLLSGRSSFVIIKTRVLYHTILLTNNKTGNGQIHRDVQLAVTVMVRGNVQAVATSIPPAIARNRFYLPLLSVRDPLSTDKSTTTEIRRWTHAVLNGQCHQNGHAQMLMDDPMSDNQQRTSNSEFQTPGNTLTVHRPYLRRQSLIKLISTEKYVFLSTHRKRSGR
jgi:hypothetical protein